MGIKIYFFLLTSFLLVLEQKENAKMGQSGS